MSTSNHYFFIEIDSPPRRKVIELVDHSTYREIYSIHYMIRTITPVHVGSGVFKIYNNRPLSVNTRDSEGRLVIPGSTMKGVVAHYHLAVIGEVNKTASLFGSPGYMSRIFFEDVKLIRAEKPWVIIDVGASWRPRKKPEKPNMIKLYRPDLKRVKEETVQYLECIPKDSMMSSKIVIVNSSINEVAEVLLSMDGLMLVGYGKPKGLGKIKIEKVEIKLFSPPSFSPVNRTKEVLQRVGKLKEKYRERVEEVFKVDVQKI